MPKMIEDVLFGVLEILRKQGKAQHAESLEQTLSNYKTSAPIPKARVRKK